MKRSIFALVLFSLFATLSARADSLVYNSFPNPLPPNLPSLGYEATSTSQFGELIQFAGGGPVNVTSVILGMSNWAYESAWEPLGTSSGFSLPFTLNLYNIGAGNTVGSLIGSDTINGFIPWRPEPTAGCGTAWLAGDGNCYNGSLSTIGFNFGGLNVPNQIIYGLAYNTTDYGSNPTHVPGPYDSLNFALATTPPSVGSDPLSDTAYWDTSYAGFYTDGGAGGVGVFRQDTGWTPYVAVAQFNATTSVPEPASLTLLGMGLFGIVVGSLKRKKK